MSTDAIVLLKTDHKDIREQFRRFQQAGENAAAAKGRIVEKIIELLTVHTYIENEVMYPEVRRLLGVEGEMGKMMGLGNDWAYNVIKAVGNYGESFERNVGLKTPLRLARGLNELWNKGGLLYAPPYR